MDMALNGTPKDAVAALSLDASKTYTATVECRLGTQEIGRVDDGSASPETSGRRGVPMVHLQSRPVKGANLWFWIPDGHGWLTIYEVP